MGRQYRNAVEKRAADRKGHETREPDEPLPGWPQSHVAAELTDDDDFECVRVTIHGVQHYLHASTARELQKALGSRLDEYNALCVEHGAPTV